MKSQAQLAAAERQRAENEAALRRGETLPFPNRWDALDPSKLAPGELPSNERLLASTRAFLKLCPLKPRRKHVI